MKVLLCCILKMENHYLEEWVRHYIKLGVDKIVMYDNNDTDGPYAEKIEDISFINEQINNGFIDVYKIPYEKCVQLKYYNQCYQKYNDYDWLLFFDIDEYLMLENFKNIKEFLSQSKFNNYDIIHVNWKTFTDNNLLTVENNDYSLVNRFTTPCENIPTLSKKIDTEIKSIVRGGINNLEFTKNPHTLDSIIIPCCDVNGDKLDNKDQKSKKVIHVNAWINHYICKTIEEYCKNKLIRLGGHTPHKRNVRYTRNFFFIYNQYTIEKIRLFNQLFSLTQSDKLTTQIKSYAPIRKISGNVYKTYTRKKIVKQPPKENEVKKIKILNSSVIKIDNRPKIKRII